MVSFAMQNRAAPRSLKASGLLRGIQIILMGDQILRLAVGMQGIIPRMMKMPASAGFHQDGFIAVAVAFFQAFSPVKTVRQIQNQIRQTPGVGITRADRSSNRII